MIVCYVCVDKGPVCGQGSRADINCAMIVSYFKLFPFAHTTSTATALRQLLEQFHSRSRAQWPKACMAPRGDRSGKLDGLVDDVTNGAHRPDLL